MTGSGSYPYTQDMQDYTETPTSWTLITGDECWVYGYDPGPVISLQWKSDESTKHYFTQMLLTINWLLTGGKKLTHAYEGSRSPHASAPNWIPPDFRKKKGSNTFLQSSTFHAEFKFLFISEVSAKDLTVQPDGISSVDLVANDNISFDHFLMQWLWMVVPVDSSSLMKYPCRVALHEPC